jgi:tetratricopeptide (TPR) repeat protein
MHTEAIESVLERALGSAAFRRAGRLRRFLEHVVKVELSGCGKRLKESQIGVAVFDRGADFDPCIDTIVRVEAIKLRERLDAYFEDEGATEPVRISIPKGSYRPVFALRDEEPVPILSDPEALYWQAKYLNARLALALLSKGIERWPLCAKLHAMLAERAAAATCSDSGYLAPREGLPLMLRSARRALELDPNCGEAHFYGNLPSVRLPNKAPVQDAMRRALSLSPRNACLHHWAAAILLTDGRCEEALLHARQAERLEPHVLKHRMRTAMVLTYSRKFDAAVGYLRDILECSPNDSYANLEFSRALCYAGRLEDAAACAGRVYAATGETNALAALGYAEALAGHTSAASKIAAKLEVHAKKRYVRPTGLAAINIALGRMDVAGDYISAAIHEGDFIFGWSKTDQRLDPLRGKVAGL